MMQPLLKHSLRWISLVMALLALAACGPGTGGTGTGPTPTNSAATGGSPVPGFTAIYTGSTTSAPSIPSGATSTCTNGCSTGTASHTVHLQLQADSIVLTAPCITFTYAGPWSVSASGVATVQGSYQSGFASPQSATMVITFIGGGTASGELSVTVTNAANSVLVGPLHLQRSSNAPPVAAPLVDDPNCLGAPAAAPHPGTSNPIEARAAWQLA
jgi:hypothetical protein